MPVSDLLLAFGELEDACPGYDEAEAFYEGTVEEVFATPTIASELAKMGEAYRFNLIKTVVTVRASRCEIAAIKVPNDESATDTIAAAWKSNTMDIHYPVLISDTLEFGDTYVMVWPVEQPVDETYDDETVTTGVEFVTQDPRNGRMMYDPENERRKWFYLKRFNVKDGAGQDVWAVDLYYEARIEHYISRAGFNLETEDAWSERMDDDADGNPGAPIERNPWGEIPFFHHRTDLPYGKPVHQQGYGAQNAINKQLITLLMTTDSQGFPQRYGLLDKDAVLDQNNDSPDWVDDSLATTSSVGGLNTEGGQVGAERTGPGTMAKYTGLMEVGQFSAADPAVFLDPTSFFIRVLAQITNTPLHYFDPTGDAPSGESLKVAEAPLIKDIEWLQLLQGSAVQEEWRFALKLLGQTVNDIDVRWASVASATGLSDWQAAQAQVDVGVPVEQVLAEAGYEPEQVRMWLDASAEAATLQQRVNLLSQLGVAMQAIGAASALGVVDMALAEQAVAVVLGQITAAGTTPDAA